MSKSFSGLFSGTKGSVLSVGASKLADAQSSKPYKATRALKEHIENPTSSSSGSEGIKCAHHKDNFMKEVTKTGAKVIGSTPNTQLDGVEQITYKMPKKDKSGKLSGGYKSKIFKKTVYNPSKIDTDTYIKWGLQAANNSAKASSSKKLGREWSGTDNQGVKWHGYCDSNGNIVSFYPEN